MVGQRTGRTIFLPAVVADRSAAAATEEHLRLFARAESYVGAVTRGTFELYCSP